MFDLHCHSVFSDGHHTPEELLQRAEQAGLRYLSLTDHDTIAGYQRLAAIAADSAVTIIPGIEFSTRWKKHDIHILGYQIMPCELLHQAIEKQNQSRIERAIQIGAALERFGVADAYQKAMDLAGHARVARPHFAQILVNEGMARDMQAAFKRCLSRGRPAYVPTPWMPLEEAVEVISRCQGMASLAHPLSYGLTRTKLNELIKDFVDAGGHAIEVVSGEMNQTQVTEMAGLCSRYKLLASTGSDFHGDKVSRVGLGRQMPLPNGCKPIWSEWNL